MKRTYLKLLKYFFIREPKTPFQLIHFVTSKCNARCGHCFFWSKLNTQGELSLEEIDKFTKTLPDLVILNISGGEPFLRPDFAEVIKTYYRNTPVKEVAIPTNGTLTEKIERDCRNILESCPGMDLNVVLSLDGPAEIHDEIRQLKDCFQNALKTFSRLRELKKEYPQLQVSIVSTLTSVNQDCLEDFHRFVKEEIRPDVFGLNLIRGEAKKMELFGVDLENYKKFFSRQSKSQKKGVKSFLRDYMNKLRTGLIIKTVEEKRCFLPCRAGTLMGVIYEKGDVFPCELLNNHSLGNIRDYGYDFSRLWKSQIAKNSAKWIKDSKCYCTHECFQRFNLLYNPLFVAKNLAKSWVGKSELIKSLEPAPRAEKNGENLIQIGKMRGVRFKHEEKND